MRRRAGLAGRERFTITLLSLLMLCLGGQTSAQPRILLVPIDDRPATTQFAEMIGAIAGRLVLMPPRSDLGRFTTPGSPQAIASWLGGFKASDAEALIVSTDMLAFGGLIASRRQGASLEEGLDRLEALRLFRRNNPGVPILAFSVVMRLAPTATATSADYHDALARYASIVDEAEQKKDPRLAAEAARLKALVPSDALEDYLATRKRNHQLNLRMLEWVSAGDVDFLILSQDDAKVYGLHRAEQRSLDAEIRSSKLENRAMLYAGADEVSNVLLSRAILQKEKLRPAISVVYSSAAGRRAVDPYEDRPLEESVRMQLLASGARGAIGTQGDCALFLHAPKTTADEKLRFFQQLLAALKSGRPVALADVVWQPVNGGPDPELIEFLQQHQVAHLVRAFASWNTAGNTLGTVIPNAAMELVLRKNLGRHRPGVVEDALRANAEFLLHRYLNDWGYHDKVRMPAYEYIRKELQGSTLELTAQQYPQAEAMVRREMRRIAQEFFKANFEGRALPIPGRPGRSMQIESLEELEVRLPWPRPFEVELRFRLHTRSAP